MIDSDILKKIKQEYELGNAYMQPVRVRYRERLLKRNPQTKTPGKINIDMIGQAIDTKIASFWSNGVKVKFISKQGWIGQEEADNLNSVAEFDKKETTQQQLEYQIEQDSEFFGVGICNKIGFDKTKIINTWRAINPLSWIPDPLPTQTGQFDGQNFRFHGFMLRTTLMDMKDRYDNIIVDAYFKKQSESESELTRQAYSRKNGSGYITCDTLDTNFSTDIYNHMTIIDGKKRIFKTDMAFGHIFDRQELKPVTKEEMLDPMLVPRPIMLNFSDPQRENPLGGSICDKLEDKQNAKSILANLNVIKAKKEATGGDFLVNSRLIKNKDAFTKKTTDSRYFFIDEEAIGNNPIQNAMFELPQSQIKTDTFAMMNFLDAEAIKDTKQDAMQMGLVPDKTMTKGEQQSIQGNANLHISLKNGIKSWYYQEFYFQRWRGYLENMKEGQKKFVLLSTDFEWKGDYLEKDRFVTKQIPYLMIGTTDDINAVNEQQKQYLNLLYPQIAADPEMPVVCKNIFKRLVHKVNGLQNNTVNSFMRYDVSERKAIEYVGMINMNYEPKTIFDNPNIDLFTLRLYIQKADDSPIKDKILNVLNKALMDLGLDGKQAQVQDLAMNNSAANQMMAKSINQQTPITSAATPGIQPQQAPATF